MGTMSVASLIEVSIDWSQRELATTRARRWSTQRD
jgi:hypothetical protein